MSGSCPAVASGAATAERLAAYVDCQSRQIDLAAFEGGIWHGLPAVLVSALMVLYVAGIGYRLILNRHFDTASLVHAGLRLGIVIALTTTLSAYSALVYTVATQGPGELAAMALAPTGLQVRSPTEASRAAADNLAALAGPAQAAPVPAAPAGVGNPSGPPSTPAPPSPPPAGSSSSLADAVFVLSCAGFGLAARMAQAIVLACGPLFIAAALFDLSIGLCIGWLRALVGLFLAQAGYAVSSAIELSFVAQDLNNLSSTPADSQAPLMIGLFFLAVGLAITAVAVVAAGGLRRPGAIRRASAEGPRTAMPAPPDVRSPWRPAEARLDHTPSRAQRVTDAVGALAEAERGRSGGGTATDHRAAAAAGSAAEVSAGTGPGLRRPGQLRASTSAARRDGMS